AEVTMATRRKAVKKKPRKRPAKRREPRTEDDILADELMRVSKREQAGLIAGWEQAMKELGIPRLKPIGAKRLRQMMIDRGLDPNGNEFSRGIIEMREE